jgi:hypothetical protein
VTSEADSKGGYTNAATGAAAVSAATATTGANANVDASAIGGAGAVQGGNATATATGNAATGIVIADAQTTSSATHPANALLSAEAYASATIATAAISKAALQYGNTAMTFITSAQAVANATLAPAASSSAVTNVLKANSAIATAFTGAKQYYAVGELGGQHATGGGGAQTTTSRLDLVLDQTTVPSGGNLIVGLYGGDTIGTGVTGVSLSVTENGTAVASLSFTNDSATAAKAAFSNMAHNLGALSGSGTIALDFTLSVTSKAAGSGFYGGIIIGDPPSPHVSPSFHTHFGGLF